MENRLQRYLDDLVEMTFDAEEVGEEYMEGACEVTLDSFCAFSASRITGQENTEIIQAVFRATSFKELRDELQVLAGGANEETSV